MKDIHLMYLASLYICFDLDPSIPQTDKERLLLSLKEKLKQKFRNKLTLKIDDQENSLALAFFEHNYEKVQFYFNEILEFLEGRSEARIHFHHEQIFSWFQGQFVDSSQQNSFNINEEKNNVVHPPYKTLSAMETHKKTIVYSDKDEDEDMSPIASRFARRNFRIPTRK
jgi:hypothetical protein